MRAVFNTTCRIRHGPRSVTGEPGVVFAEEVPCRVVPQTKITQGDLPFSLADAWLTEDTVDLIGPRVLSPWNGSLWVDYLAADQVELDGLAGVWYSVCRHESIGPDVGGDYHRYLLIPPSAFEPPVWPPRAELPPDPTLTELPEEEPGATCDVAAELLDLGEYLLASEPDGLSGWYYLDVGEAAAVRITIIGHDEPEWRVDVHTTTPGGGLCTATWVGALGYSGYEELVVSPDTHPGDTGRIILNVTRGLGVGGGVEVPVSITAI